MPRTLHDITGAFGRSPDLRKPDSPPRRPAPPDEAADPEFVDSSSSSPALPAEAPAPDFVDSSSSSPALPAEAPAPDFVDSLPSSPALPAEAPGPDCAAIRPVITTLWDELSDPKAPAPPPSIPASRLQRDAPRAEPPREEPLRKGITEPSPIDELLQIMVDVDASDLHLKVGSPPGLRVCGSLRPIPDAPILTPEDTWALISLILTREQMEQFRTEGDFDLAYSATGIGRFRVNAMMQRGSAGMVLRRIPYEIPSLKDLNLPSVCETLVMKPRGLVLITGPTGSGKSTTLASMIDHRNRREAGHILTLEDPIEFVHSDRMSYVNQREVGADTKTFTDGLRRALRQDPDVILIGELRDLETISMALTAAETGHLVLATLHTTGAVQTVDRIVDVFPSGQQQQVRLQLSGALQGVISQVLLPKIGGGRVAALEILVAVDAVRACIREGKTPQIVNALQTGGRLGMTLLDASLAQLVQTGQVELKEALAKANKPDEFRELIKK